MTQVAESANDPITQWVTFFLDNEKYGIKVMQVQEVLRMTEIAPVPGAPQYVLGIINLRGNVVPVVDLCARLGKGRSELSKRSCIVLVEVDTRNERQQLGMLVDEVNEILEIPASHLQPAPDFGTDIRTDFIQAMGRVDDVFMILLDINHVLSVEELSQLDKFGKYAGQLQQDEVSGGSEV